MFEFSEFIKFTSNKYDYYTKKSIQWAAITFIARSGESSVDNHQFAELTLVLIGTYIVQTCLISATSHFVGIWQIKLKFQTGDSLARFFRIVSTTFPPYNQAEVEN